MTPGESHSHEGGLSVREQIERYRKAFIAVVTMIVIAALVGGYILAHENLKLPGWVPVLGRNYFVLKGEFQTAQAVTPGQGQAVTIAGAKIGEIASVDLRNGVAVVTMHLVPKYSEGRLYHDATMLLRPKTQLKDMTVEVDPGIARERAAAQRRDDPAVADRARRQLRRIPRGPGRGHARLPAGAAGGRGRRARRTTARRCRRRSSASTRPRATRS